MRMKCLQITEGFGLRSRIAPDAGKAYKKREIAAIGPTKTCPLCTRRTGSQWKGAALREARG